MKLELVVGHIGITLVSRNLLNVLSLMPFPRTYRDQSRVSTRHVSGAKVTSTDHPLQKLLNSEVAMSKTHFTELMASLVLTLYTARIDPIHGSH